MKGPDLKQKIHSGNLVAGPPGRATSPSTIADFGAVIVCWSHLRWNWVWQRPQHLLSRFARNVPVVMIEEPQPTAEAAPRLESVHKSGVTVLTPYLPGAPSGFGDTTNLQIRSLIEPYLNAVIPATAAPIFWYYTPMALGAEPATITPALVVYDAMDDLASFRNAPPRLREREAALLKRADLVFAGGPSLYQSRRDRHPAVYSFPSGVDPDHFAQAQTLSPPPELAAVPRPIVGYYGVLDERLDLDLLASLATARPDWSIVLIGPVAKISEQDLPRQPNIHYLGPRTYEELPACLSAFDVAILPFADNEATKFISPTKTLEYLAGEKPVVSTPIHDVVELYGEAVTIAATPEAFAAAIERHLTETPRSRIRRLTKSRELVARANWDDITGSMDALMASALARRYGVGKRSAHDAGE